MSPKQLDIDDLAKKFLQKCQSLPKIKVAVVYPCSKDSLDGALEAAHLGLIEPILIGPKETIQKLADELQMSIKSTSLSI